MSQTKSLLAPRTLQPISNTALEHVVGGWDLVFMELMPDLFACKIRLDMAEREYLKNAGFEFSNTPYVFELKRNGISFSILEFFTKFPEFERKFRGTTYMEPYPCCTDIDCY